MHRTLPNTLVALSAAFLLICAGAGGNIARGQDIPEPGPAGMTGPAVMAVVSLRDQTIALYDADGGTLRAGVSSGRRDYETPVGVYSILQKKEEHYSNLYDDASMPFMQRITWSGIALHAGELPGRPASHGCVRMPYTYAQEIYPLTRMGMRVVVAREDVAPVAISHPRLLKPDPVDRQAALKQRSAAPRSLATPTAYEPETDASGIEISPLEANVRAWPARQAQLEAYRVIAAAKKVEAEAASEHVEDRKATVKEAAAAEKSTSRVLRRAEGAKSKSVQALERADRQLAAAKKQASIKSAEDRKAKAEAALADAEQKLADAKMASDTATAAHTAAKDALAAAEAAKKAADDAAREAKRKTYPVSIFVSLKAQRLYVRQGHHPVLDVPLAVADPELPIGTHVYTAVDYTDDSASDLRWTVVSIGDHAPADVAQGARKSRRSAKNATARPTDTAAATAALERFTIPSEVLSQVSAYVWPGSSIIVSDEDASVETGQATDFVVLISGEPQGGIKKRPRRPPQPDYYSDRYYDYYYSDYYDRPRRSRRYNPPFFSFW